MLSLRRMRLNRTMLIHPGLFGCRIIKWIFVLALHFHRYRLVFIVWGVIHVVTILMGHIACVQILSVMFADFAHSLPNRSWFRLSMWSCRSFIEKAFKRLVHLILFNSRPAYFLEYHVRMRCLFAKLVVRHLLEFVWAWLLVVEVFYSVRNIWSSIEIIIISFFIWDLLALPVTNFEEKSVIFIVLSCSAAYKSVDLCNRQVISPPRCSTIAHLTVYLFLLL